jgi:hypothetical protein
MEVWGVTERLGGNRRRKDRASLRGHQRCWHKLLSRKVSNDETDVLQLVGEVAGLADGGRILWATDLNAGGAALLIAVLVEHEQELLYIPGRTVHHASAAYRGDGKTDAKDAAVIADQARMRRDLHSLRHRDETAVALRMLCARRTDLSADRTRAINRLRAQLLEYFPALERAFAVRPTVWPRSVRCTPQS